MANTSLFKTYDVSGTLAPYRIVAHAAPFTVKQAAAPTEPLLGTTDELGKQSNGRADIALSDLPEVEAGAALTAGAAITSDAEGRAIPASATGQRIIGFALANAATGDIITYQCAPGLYAVTGA